MDAGSTFILTGIFVFALWIITGIITFSIPFLPYILCLLSCLAGIYFGGWIGEKVADKYDISGRRREDITVLGLLLGMAFLGGPSVLVIETFITPRWNVGRIGHDNMQAMCSNFSERELQKVWGKTCAYLETIPAVIKLEEEEEPCLPTAHYHPFMTHYCLAQRDPYVNWVDLKD